MPEEVRVFVGVDRSQILAVKVLEHSIKRHTKLPVVVTPMLDLPIREPKDPRNLQRTGFSFSRYCIPKFAGYTGRAIYMDADMLVFQDIKSLWEIPFEGAKVIVQREVKHLEETLAKVGAPKKRKKQCAVMLLDCGRLDWKIESIIDGLDEERYDYEQLMYDLCILKEDEIKYGVPFEWNSLEYYDKDTNLLHYTDVHTQPWTSCLNRYAEPWFAEVRLMLKNGALSRAELQQEIDLGYFRPSLMLDIQYRHLLPKVLHRVWDAGNIFSDKLRGYVPHRDVYATKKRRLAAVKAYEAAHGISAKAATSKTA